MLYGNAEELFAKFQATRTRDEAMCWETEPLVEDVVSLSLRQLSRCLSLLPTRMNWKLIFITSAFRTVFSEIGLVLPRPKHWFYGVWHELGTVRSDCLLFFGDYIFKYIFGRQFSKRSPTWLSHFQNSINGCERNFQNTWRRWLVAGIFIRINHVLNASPMRSSFSYLVEWLVSNHSRQNRTHLSFAYIAKCIPTGNACQLNACVCVLNDSQQLIRDA